MICSMVEILFYIMFLRGFVVLSGILDKKRRNFMDSKKLLKLTEEDKQLVTDISFLSGYPQKMVTEIYRYLLFAWARKIAENEGKLVSLRIPYMGYVGVRYEGDSLNVDGTLATDIMSMVAPSPEFKTLVGEIHDDAENVVTSLLKTMIEESLVTISNDGYDGED